VEEWGPVIFLLVLGAVLIAAIGRVCISVGAKWLLWVVAGGIAVVAVAGLGFVIVAPSECFENRLRHFVCPSDLAATVIYDVSVALMSISVYGAILVVFLGGFLAALALLIEILARLPRG
jgi:hypothetical protein